MVLLFYCMANSSKLPPLIENVPVVHAMETAMFVEAAVGAKCVSPYSVSACDGWGECSRT